METRESERSEREEKMTNKAKGVRFYARQIHVFSLLTLWFFKFYQIMFECQRVCVCLLVCITHACAALYSNQN